MPITRRLIAADTRREVGAICENRLAARTSRGNAVAGTREPKTSREGGVRTAEQTVLTGISHRDRAVTDKLAGHDQEGDAMRNRSAAPS